MSDSDHFDPSEPSSPHRDLERRVHDPDRMRTARHKESRGVFYDPFTGGGHKTPGKTVRTS